MKEQKSKKLIFAAQALYMSKEQKLKTEGSILLSMLLHVCAHDYLDIVPIAHSMFVTSGDFPNINLLNKSYNGLDFKYSFYSEIQMEFRKSLNTIPELSFPLTDFQRLLWEDLSSDKDIITVAPTSAGKTHIILNYLLNKVVKSEGAFAAIVVPTRALISEVAGKIYELAKNLNYENEIGICTVPKEGNFGSKTLFVMTQERIYEILLRGDLSFDYLFIDEAQNITNDSRGVLLHLTIEKMLEDSLPQVIISMPSPSYQDSFSTIFKDITFKKEITERSPVAKVFISVVPKQKNLIISRNDSTNSKIIPKGFSGTDIADIIYKLGQTQSNIIYRNRTDSCENLANKIADRVIGAEQNDLLKEAANYVEEFVHKEFSLGSNLRKGVAFHYGPLPSSIRVMIENLAKDGQIKFIVCTSTLAEGVNLPAKNLFLENPFQSVTYEPSKRLEKVTIDNITGRAGRMLQHFSGNIFLIKPESWRFKDYFDYKEEKEKIPTYFKTLSEDLTPIINALDGRHAHDEKDQYKLYTIANKLIKEFAANKLGNTLHAAELTLSQSDKKLLQEKVAVAYENLKVAAFTLEANPTVGYIQQNKLFSFLEKQSSLQEWVLPHPRSTDLYDTLFRVCTELQSCGVYVPSDGYSLKYICSITKKWIQGNSLKDIISEQIKWDTIYAKSKGKNPSSVNKCVRDIIKVINNDIRFRLSNALRCYHILLDNILISRRWDLHNVKIHSFIEIGACDGRMINLINIGLSREAAKEIDSNLPQNEDINSATELLKLYNNGKLENIHNITRKELIELLSIGI